MHIAIIMDGNGRWATQRGLPRTAGHVRGARSVRRIVRAAAHGGIDTLTLYAFSADNWQRPATEVGALLELLRRYLLTETHRCVEQHVRVNIIGRRDRLDPSLLSAIEQCERLTAQGSGLNLRIAVDYSARQSILQAAQRAGAVAAAQTAGEGDEQRLEFLRLIGEVDHSAAAASEVDLLIRTGGEKRLSDFLLWECAYAELYFTDCLWPDFDEQALASALRDYAGRQRRFGRVPGIATA